MPDYFLLDVFILQVKIKIKQCCHCVLKAVSTAQRWTSTFIWERRWKQVHFRRLWVGFDEESDPWRLSGESPGPESFSQLTAHLDSLYNRGKNNKKISWRQVFTTHQTENGWENLEDKYSPLLTPVSCKRNVWRSEGTKKNKFHESSWCIQREVSTDTLKRQMWSLWGRTRAFSYSY